MGVFTVHHDLYILLEYKHLRHSILRSTFSKLSISLLFQYYYLRLTMSLKFYYKTYSTADLTVAVLAELEHGLSEPIAERIEVDLQKGESRTPEYLKGVNPNGLVPAIVHDGVSIWEASAITMYLGETFGVERPANNKEAPVLYPPPGTSRGKAMTWIVWASTELGKKGVALGESQASKSKVCIWSCF